ncbi:MAG: hypothetical protein QXV49_00835 [Conexivisphaerales archaeon]
MLWKRPNIVHSEMTGAGERSKFYRDRYESYPIQIKLTLTRSGTYAIPRVCS